MTEPLEPLSVRVGVGWNPLDRDGSGERFWETVEMLESDGWDSLWLSDSATRGGVAPLPMLAAVAARTERLKLGTSVLAVAARSPVLLAKELATAAAARRVGRIADGWLASGVSPDQFGSLVQVIRDQATESGRTVPEDHFGTILLVAADGADVDWVGRSALVRRAVGSETVAIGADQVRDRLERFRAGGATKFVLYPLAADPRPLLRELKAAVVDPLEAAPVLR
jgi:alkanesulfonate monooxygenase SsuD/methylene tetrahydromethanopterin reductase-like flavin-dependent oxidoreductase (luciferase family)